VASALFSVAEARAFDRGQLADSTRYPDAAIEWGREAVAGIIAAVTGREWVDKAVTETVDGSGAALLSLSRLPVASVTGVSVYDGSTWVDLDADELAALEVVPDSGILRRDAVWPAGLANVRVSYVAGAAEVPAPLKYAALRLVVELAARTNLTGRETAYSDGQLSYQLATPGANWGWWTSLPEVNAILALYVHWEPA